MPSDPWVKAAADLNSRKINGHTGVFIPSQWIKDVLSAATVQHLLSYLNPDGHGAWPLRTAVEEVMRGKYLFAAVILARKQKMVIQLLLLGMFNDTQQYNETKYHQNLDEYFPEDEVRELFDNLRFMRTLTLIRGVERDLTKMDVNMPFLKEEKSTPQGSYGIVREVVVCMSNLATEADFLDIEAVKATQDGGFFLRNWPLNRIRLILKSVNEGEAAEAEVRALMRIRHSNVVPLLFSYCHRNMVNMLFPIYKDRLADYSFQPNWSSQDLAMALAQLWGGLQSIHELESTGYTSDVGIGSHNDLKPDNIMIDSPRKNFVIIDLGFADIKDPSQTSKIGEGKDNRSGDYTAPESLSTSTPISSRKKDVWALACISAEIIVLNGPERVTRREFRKARKQKEEEMQPNHYFHSKDRKTGKRKLHTRVEEHLEALTTFGDPTYQEMSRYLKDTLHKVDPKDRPEAKLVAEVFLELANSRLVRKEIDILPENSDSKQSRSGVESIQSLAVPSSLPSFNATNAPNGSNGHAVQLTASACELSSVGATQKTLSHCLKMHFLNTTKAQRTAGAIWNQFKIRAGSIDSKVLLVCHEEANLESNQNILSSVIARAIQSIRTCRANIITVYHFCERRTSALEVAKDILAQLSSELSARKIATDTVSDLGSSDVDQTMKAFVHLYQSLPEDQQLAIFIDKLSMCNDRSDTLWESSRIAEPLTKEVHRNQNLESANHSRIKVFLSVSNREVGNQAMKLWGICSSELLFNTSSFVSKDSNINCMGHEFWSNVQRVPLRWT